MKKEVEYATPSSVKRVSLIEVISLRGAGTPENVIRRVFQYYTDDGKLVAENDMDEKVNKNEDFP